MNEEIEDIGFRNEWDGFPQKYIDCIRAGHTVKRKRIERNEFGVVWEHVCEKCAIRYRVEI